MNALRHLMQDRTGPSHPRRVHWMLAAAAAMVAAAAGVRTQGQSGPSASASSPVMFEETARRAGLVFNHEKTILDAKLSPIMPWMTSLGSSVAAGDYNNDGCIDLYVTTSNLNGQNRLFKNKCRGGFTSVAQGARGAGLHRNGAAMGAGWGDYNNDGCVDLLVLKWGKSELFRNNCDGTFTRVTDGAGVGFDGYANGAVWFDYNRDGCLDLYVLGYFRPEHDLWHLNTTVVMNDDFERARNGGRNALYRNNCDGTFTNVGASLGVDDPGWSLAAGAADLDGDGWPDLYVANDFGPDRLWLNDGGRAFRFVRQTRGISDDTKKGMNVDFGDYDNDGRLDIYVTNVTKHGYLVEGNMLWHHTAAGWRDTAVAAGVWDCGWSWAAKFFDADNDGWLDLFVVNGFVSAGSVEYWYDLGTMATTPDLIVADAANWPPMGDKSLSGYESSCLFINNHNGTFREAAWTAGIRDRDDGRAIAAVDYDNDGTLDLVVANQGQPLLLYRNRGAPEHHWLELRLVGTRSNRQGIGALITVFAGGVRQIREANSGQGGFASQSDPRVHFGLGDARVADTLTIHWPSGFLQTLQHVSADRVVTVIEPSP